MNAYSKYFDKIKVRRSPEAERASSAPACQWDGCKQAGTHRAPVGRMAEGQYFKFCFDHVREYNKGFNYFSGLAEGEIARFQKEAMTGHRPTWKMGVSNKSGTQASPNFAQTRSGTAKSHARTRDPFGMFKDAIDPADRPRTRKLKTLEAKAMETLGLDAAATGAQIKQRYKELVKRHHPDANGGDRASEDRFRDVIQAYRMLKQAGLC